MQYMYNSYVYITFEKYILILFSPDYGVDFFKKFTMVMNALDNRGEKTLLNKLCL